MFVASGETKPRRSRFCSGTERAEVNAEAVVLAELTPDPLRERPQFVDDDRRVGVALVKYRAVRLDQGQQLVESQCRNVDVCGWEVRIFDAAEVCVGEPEDRVDRGQPRPENEDGSVMPGKAVLPRPPRIADPGRMARQRLGAGQGSGASFPVASTTGSASSGECCTMPRR